MTLFGAAPISAIQSTVRWNWDSHPWMTGLLAAAILAWVGAVYANEQRFVGRRVRAALAMLRLAAVAIVLVMLAQPVMERSRIARPRMALLLDRSGSMSTRDVPAGDLSVAEGATASISRAEAWESILMGGEHPMLDELQARYQVDVVGFAKEAARMEPAPSQPIATWLQSMSASDEPSEDNGTQLGDAIDFAVRQLEGPRPVAVVVMTDGVNTAGLPLEDAAARARTVGVPLYAVALGSDRPRPDVSLDDVLVEEVVFAGDRLQVEATIRASGYGGKKARVVLKREGAEELMAETTIALPADGDSQAVRLALRPSEPGPLHLVLEVDVQPDENDTANNRASVTIDVRKEPIRVLLVDSTPSYEYRALKSLLERDPAIKLRVRLQDADADYASIDAAALRDFPASEAELLGYDVVLLGDVDPQLLPQKTWNALREFVSQHGGGLVLIAGRRFMPHAMADVDAIRVLLPIESRTANPLRTAAVPPGGYLIQPTPLGLQQSSMQLGDTIEALAAIWAALPGVEWALEGIRTKPGVQVLAAFAPVAAATSPTAPPAEAGSPGGSPAILRQYVGAGEVLMHATDETWRWRWRSDDRYFARYWGQVVRRLARGRALRGAGSLSASQSVYQLGTPVTISARPRPTESQANEALTVELEGANLPTQQVRLERKSAYANLFEAVLRDLPPDQYTARLTTDGELTATFVVEAPPGEMAHLAVNTSGLAEAAKTTGGKLYTAKSANRLVEELPAADPIAVEQLPDEPLWSRPWLLGALCLLLSTEWLMRRRSGML